MSGNGNLRAARRAKNDEFYTRYEDVEAELNAYVAYDPNVFHGRTVLLPCDDPDRSNFTRYFTDNFTRFGLEKLVSTSITVGGRGKLFTLTRDEGGRGIRGLLHGDGDFRSPEVTRLRDQADFIITNPPFSLFHEFLPWLLDSGKRFTVLGNVNAVAYKEVFPAVKGNRLWIGEITQSGNGTFYVPDDYPLNAKVCGVTGTGRKFVQVTGVRWYTNIPLDRRYRPLRLNTMQHNLNGNEKLRRRLRRDYRRIEYPHYDNYDAIEIPYVDAIPSDYDGIMGVPITFLDKYCPDQFEILEVTQRGDNPYRTKRYTTADYPNANDLNAHAVIMVNGHPKSVYARIFIRRKR